MRYARGFTVPELVVVIFVLLGALLMAAILLKPADYSVQEQQATRFLDAARIMQAITRYQADTGALPPDLPTEPIAIGNTGVGTYDLCSILVPKYIKDIPLDPVIGLKSTDNDDNTKLPCSHEDVGYLSGYTIGLDESGVVVGTMSEAEVLDLGNQLSESLNLE